MTIPNFKPEEQIVYAISIGIHHKFDLYINDIKSTNNNVGYMAIDINPYVLRNGKYKVKVVLYPEDTSKAFLDNTRIQLVKYLKDSKGEYVDGSRVELKMLPIVYPPNNQNPFEQEWEVELTELPYELEGWSKGQDLSKMDKRTLEDSVLKHYEKLRNILNDGKGKEYIKEWSIADNELLYYDYDNKTSIDLSNEEFEETIENKCKNRMLPIENYMMVLYAQGKIVSLERIDKENKGKGILMRKTDRGGTAIYNVKLYLPEGSNEFVIIRK